MLNYKALMVPALIAMFACVADARDNSWVRTWGGSENDEVYSIARDQQGDILATGAWAETVDFDPGAGVITSTATTGSDVFISKFSPDGGLLWSRQFPGGGSDVVGPGGGFAIAIDSQGGVYVGGKFSSPEFEDGTLDFDPGPGVHLLADHYIHGGPFIAKFSADGDFEWASDFTSPGANSSGYAGQITDLAVDDQDNLWMTGVLGGTMRFSDEPNVIELDPTDMGGVFVAKYDPSGKCLRAGRIVHTSGLSGEAISHELVVADNGIWVAGAYNGRIDIDPGPGEHRMRSMNQSWDAFLLKLDFEGNLVKVITWGGMSDEGASAVAFDSQGSIYASGKATGEAQFDMKLDGEKVPLNDVADAYLVKFNSDGQNQWVRTWGWKGEDSADQLAIGPDGLIYVAGTFTGPVDFDPGEGVALHTSTGAKDSYVSAFNPDGDFQWVKTFDRIEAVRGEEEGTVIHSMLLEPDGEMYLGGYFCERIDLGTGNDSDIRESNGWRDAFLIRTHAESLKVGPGGAK